MKLGAGVGIPFLKLGTGSSAGGEPPVNTVAPVISGSGNDNNAIAGETLTASAGTWKFTPNPVTYSWRRNVTTILGSGNSYVVQAGDVGGSIDCLVTATNAFGSTSAATSNQYTIA